MTPENPAGDEPLVNDEESAAAAEAAAIGGARPDYDVDDNRRDDEAWRPLEEAGEGEAEGFELAEHDLVEEASHGEEGRSPEVDGFTPEVESDEAGAVYGEPDEVDPTEVVRDPREDEDDPGAGPGVAADR